MWCQGLDSMIFMVPSNLEYSVVLRPLHGGSQAGRCPEGAVHEDTWKAVQGQLQEGNPPATMSGRTRRAGAAAAPPQSVGVGLLLVVTEGFFFLSSFSYFHCFLPPIVPPPGLDVCPLPPTHCGCKGALAQGWRAATALMDTVGSVQGILGKIEEKKNEKREKNEGSKVRA